MPQAILVVDDEPTLADSVALFLGDEGFTVLTARNGAEALAHHDQTPADLIVTDVMMPIVDGHALVAALRYRGDRTPVVLMSAGNTGFTTGPACGSSRSRMHSITLVPRSSETRRA